MPKAVDILARKSASGRGTDVVTIRSSATVAEAAKLMNEHRIGALGVVDDGEGLVGMFTERDVLTRIVAQERAPSETTVREVMTTPVAACAPETPANEMRCVMREKRIRHLPVVDDGRVIGMVSLGDLNACDAEVMTETISYLEQFMYRP